MDQSPSRLQENAVEAPAAALGGYLRSARLVEALATIEIRQGEARGRRAD